MIMQKQAGGIRIVVSFLALCILLSMLLVSYASADNEVVCIPDPNLEQAIRDELDKQESDIIQGDIKGITALNPAEREIEDLAELSYVVNLEDLNLAGNQVSDLTPLA